MKIQHNVVLTEFFPQKFLRGKQLLHRPHLNVEGRGHHSPTPYFRRRLRRLDALACLKRTPLGQSWIRHWSWLYNELQPGINAREKYRMKATRVVDDTYVDRKLTKNRLKWFLYVELIDSKYILIKALHPKLTGNMTRVNSKLRCTVL